MKHYDFTPEDKLAIAEYIYSYHIDILIKGDATTLIEILSAYEIIKDKQRWLLAIETSFTNTLAHSLMSVLDGILSKEQAESIMEEYYSGKL